MNWIIGDIHGCYHTLDDLIFELIEYDKEISSATPTAFYFVGDYIDRGLHSKETVDFLISLKNKYPCRFARGNHDDMMIASYGNNSYTYLDGQDPIEMFWDQGMKETLQSYGYSTKKGFAPPESHMNFFDSLEDIIVEPDFFVCHSMYPRHDVHSQVNRQDMQCILWNRFTKNQMENHVLYDRRGFFGHTPVQFYGKDYPMIFPSVVLVDTGSCFKGAAKLSAITSDTNHQIMVETNPKDLNI